eukprot:m.319310 g.319310  ORF g.319310 m.319310 type:complete len:493 (+) comp16445_c0_seq90:461-1939(+)
MVAINVLSPRVLPPDRRGRVGLCRGECPYSSPGVGQSRCRCSPSQCLHVPSEAFQTNPPRVSLSLAAAVAPSAVSSGDLFLRRRSSLASFFFSSATSMVSQSMPAVGKIWGASWHSALIHRVTDEGDLMAAAGVSFTVGREGRDTYNETDAGRRPFKCGYGFKAPINPYDAGGKVLPLISTAPVAADGAADSKVMAYNYRVCLTNATDPSLRVNLSKPAGYDSSQFEAVRRYMIALPPKDLSTEVLKIYMVATNGDGIKADVNGATYPFSTDLVGGSWSYPNGTASERRAVIAAHVAYTKGLLWFFATDPSVPQGIRNEMATWGWCADEFVDNDNFPFQLYVREGRRMVGAAVVTENDVRRGHFADPLSVIGVADYATDCHGVETVVDSTSGTPTAALEGCIDGPMGPWEIPYAAITPRETEATNLLVPVAVSASHVAFATIRLELTWMVLGQSAGVAAAIAAIGGVPVQQVPLPALHAALLKAGQVLRAER